MITGVAAFTGDSPVAVALKQIREYPKRPREIVPLLSRPIEAVIMKCLQKDAAKRYQSVDAFEAALVKAAKARPVSPWEAAVNKWLANADAEIRRRLHQGIEKAEAFLERQDWSGLVRGQKEPTAMLGVAGLAGALAIFILAGTWKPRTINAQPAPAVSQISPVSVTATNYSDSGYASRPAQNSLQPIASHDVDLYEDARADKGMKPSVDPGLTKHNIVDERPTLPAASPKLPQIVQRAKSPAGTDERKANSVAQASTQLQALASPPQPEIATSAGTPTSTTDEAPAKDLSQPGAAPESTDAHPETASQPKTGNAETKTPNLYFEVGNFKDETWANNAVEKLTQLGFHAMLIHKNLLWAQSYHVQVGPYTSQKEFAEAKQNLASQGFKAHPVN
jgi:cell division protein FtsN